MKRIIKFLILLALVFNPILGLSQSGIQLPCPDCGQDFVKPTPYEGSWFNPEQSGTGFLLEVQNDKLLGYYFGYDDEGGQLWALFNGQLQDATEQGAMWKVNSTLQKAVGGNCINCEYKPPSEFIDIGEIEMVFNRLAHASFSINGGEVQNITPLYYRYQITNHLSEISSFPLPEIEGWWTVFIDSELDIPDQYTYRNYLVNIGKSRVGADEIVRFSTRNYSSPPESIDAGTIECSNQFTNDSNQVTCTMGTFDNFFNINLANISPDRIYGESIEGDTLEMIRVSSDLCMSFSTPENCINTNVFNYLDD